MRDEEQGSRSRLRRKTPGAGTRRTANKGSPFTEAPKVKVEHYSQFMVTGVSRLFYEVLAVFVPSDLMPI
jgi:hypothetical protein